MKIKKILEKQNMMIASIEFQLGLLNVTDYADYADKIIGSDLTYNIRSLR